MRWIADFNGVFTNEDWVFIGYMVLLVYVIGIDLKNPSELRVKAKKEGRLVVIGAPAMSRLKKYMIGFIKPMQVTINKEVKK